MSLVSKYRLQFLITWLAMDASLRAALSPRQVPAVVGLLAQARAMQQALHPWLVAVLTRRERLAWTLHPPHLPDGLAAHVQDALKLELFDPRELRRWPTPWLGYLLEAELARLVWLLEAPTVLMARPGWERWEAARWALATCLARISQLARALAQWRSSPPCAGLNAALEATWQRLTVDNWQEVA
ncbi:MAG TPA: hypothetical protein VKT82_34970 [Ktedonobacterales bacterium]|nr:hypothetical protein [Ktedonobacterales bacterium]